MTVTASPRTTQVTVKPIAGVIGAEIGGVDLSEPLTTEEVNAIRTALLKWKVIFFRDQYIGPDQQIAFGRRFGQVTKAHPTLPPLDGYPEVLELSSEAYQLEDEPMHSYENLWHTDVTFVHNPPLGSILRAVTVPEHGGDTGWSNLVAAYESLSDPLRRLADGLVAVHRNELHLELGAHKAGPLRDKFTSSAYTTAHPVVRVHPETGERALFVNPQFTSHIVGLRNRESRRLLELFYEAISDPRNTVRFRWEPGSIAFWDNRSTAHLAAFDHLGIQTRVHHRITLAGDVPNGPEGQVSEVLIGGAFN